MNLNVITPEDATAITEEVKRPENPTPKIARRGKKKPGAVPQVTEDDLYTRLLKYIPTPLIGLYLLLINGALSAFDGKTRTVAAWVLFAVFAVSIIPFLRTRAVRRPSQVATSVAAFVAWAIASPGPFSILGGWNAFYGTIALGVMTLFVLIYQAKPLPANVLAETVRGN
jgi:hypothetical protein